MRFTFSIRTYISALVVAAILPVLIFAGLLVNRAAINEQDQMAQTMRDTARETAIDLNRRVDGLVSLALSIAAARTLQTAELPVFYARWARVVRREGLTAELFDTTGRQILNTVSPLGTELPPRPEIVGATLAREGIAPTGLSVELRDGKPVVNINVPVHHDGRLVFILSLQITNAIRALLVQQVLLPDQVAQVTDRDGTTVSLVSGAPSDTTVRSLPDFTEQIAGRDEGSFHAKSADGVPIFVAFNRVPAADWVLTVAMPSERLFAPVRFSIFRLAALAAVTLLIAGALAWIIGRGVARSMTSLTGLARSLADGSISKQTTETRIREINAVATSMRAASNTIHQQIRQREQAEAQLIQSQKMEAIGQLTGGIAHDFNNLLAVIVGCLELLGERMTDDPASHDFVAEAMAAAARGSEMTRQLLIFARRQRLVPVRCDVNQVITEFTRLLRRTLGEDIVIELRLAPDLWPVRVDRVQFESAITNLATNARHAMPSGGHLTIATRNTRLDEDYAATHLDVAAGAYVLIEVRDTGIGMTQEVMEKIFEPFFTTMEPGKGTGLGLSMVFGFMKQSGGHISVYSEPGEGTTFRLYLPPAQDADAADEATTSGTSPAPIGHGQTILVVEDNAVLRRILCRQLIGAGYRVLEADRGGTALDMIQRGEPFDLLLTDIVMPGGMNGRELARLAGFLRPGLKILLTSGFSDSGETARASAERVLRKPYQKEELLRTVHDVLNEQTVLVGN
jgi:signal transduction histidine kinase